MRFRSQHQKSIRSFHRMFMRAVPGLAVLVLAGMMVVRL